MQVDVFFFLLYEIENKFEEIFFWIMYKNEATLNSCLNFCDEVLCTFEMLRSSISQNPRGLQLWFLDLVISNCEFNKQICANLDSLETG